MRIVLEKGRIVGNGQDFDDAIITNTLTLEAPATAALADAVGVAWLFQTGAMRGGFKSLALTASFDDVRVVMTVNGFSSQLRLDADSIGGFRFLWQKVRDSKIPVFQCQLVYTGPMFEVLERASKGAGVQGRIVIEPAQRRIDEMPSDDAASAANTQADGNRSLGVQ